MISMKGKVTLMSTNNMNDTQEGYQTLAPYLRIMEKAITESYRMARKLITQAKSNAQARKEIRMLRQELDRQHELMKDAIMGNLAMAAEHQKELEEYQKRYEELSKKFDKVESFMNKNPDKSMDDLTRKFKGFGQDIDDITKGTAEMNEFTKMAYVAIRTNDEQEFKKERLNERVERPYSHEKDVRHINELIRKKERLEVEEIDMGDVYEQYCKETAVERAQEEAFLQSPEGKKHQKDLQNDKELQEFKGIQSGKINAWNKDGTLNFEKQMQLKQRQAQLAKKFTPKPKTPDIAKNKVQDAMELCR